ncbi:CBS domain-containing protein, partial [Streptomyces atacamensis]
SSVKPAASLRDLVRDHDLHGILEWLETHPPHVIADELGRMDAGRRLTGVVELRELVLNEPGTLVAELVVTEPASAYATDSAEDAA